MYLGTIIDPPGTAVLLTYGTYGTLYRVLRYKEI